MISNNGINMNSLIISSARTGSTFLKQILPNYAGEIWLKAIAKQHGWKHEDAVINPKKYFESWLSKGFIGAKLQIGQLDWMAFPKLITFDVRKLKNNNRKSPNITRINSLLSIVDRVVLLRRRNFTEQAISFRMAGIFGWHNVGSRDDKQISPITLDIAELKMCADFWFENYKKWHPLIKKMCEIKYVWYEDLYSVPLDTCNDVRKFLQLPTVNVINYCSPILRSQARYKRLIANLPEIIKEMGAIYGIPFGNPGTKWTEMGW